MTSWSVQVKKMQLGNSGKTNGAPVKQGAVDENKIIRDAR